MNTATWAAGSPVVRVLIADDHGVVRDGLKALVNAQPGLQVVGEAADGHAAWEQACALKPDVLVLDLSMPGASGADVATRVARQCPQVRVLALTMREERGYVTRLLRAGAAGYLLKRTASSELVRAIRAVAAGGTYLDPSLAVGLLTRTPPRHDVTGERLRDLTPREGEVLRLVACGYSNKEVGAALDISVKTVETHKANAMTKLGLTSRAALVRFAASEGWIGDGWAGVDRGLRETPELARGIPDLAPCELLSIGCEAAHPHLSQGALPPADRRRGSGSRMLTRRLRLPFMSFRPSDGSSGVRPHGSDPLGPLGSASPSAAAADLTDLAESEVIASIRRAFVQLRATPGGRAWVAEPHLRPLDALPSGALAALLEDLREATSKYTRALRNAGAPPERVLPRVKSAARAALVAEQWADHDAGDALTSYMVTWSIRAYFDR